jgi:hypothetical protein
MTIYVLVRLRGARILAGVKWAAPGSMDVSCAQDCQWYLPSQAGQTAPIERPNSQPRLILQGETEKEVAS